ncbi:MAG: phosphatidylserine/phosphatidylglycerophosphate/cardiolipin synthase family protein [Ardenticatenaceae bacterium]|nr:phosphatidylserine/phosphatidylglycerophosphate/cardiolipin synthase family protein [Ardenticatenaceae bacterium]
MNRIMRIGASCLMVGLLAVVLAPRLNASANSFVLYFTHNLAATGTSPDTTEMEQALIDLLDSAQVSVDAAIYGFNRASIRDALLAAHQRGVAVRIVTDDEARYSSSTYVPYYAALAAAGISIVDDSRPGSLMHNKFFIIDGTVVWTGSANMTDGDFTLNHNNTAVFTSPALAGLYTTEFEQMFVDHRFSTAKLPQTIHTITDDGVQIELYFSPKNNAGDAMLEEVAAATDTIYFSIYFLTDDHLRDALIARAADGVVVRGVWDRLGASNAYSDDEALCQVGMPIKFENLPGLMHNKYMVIDPNGPDPRVITGSMNWSAAGDESNDENLLILHSAAEAQAYYQSFMEIYNALPAETSCNPDPGSEYWLYVPFVIR